MGLFGDFGVGGIIIKDGIDLAFPTKKERKKAEMKVREVSETVGDFLEGVNNVLDSKENLEEGTNPLLRLKRALEGMTVEEALASLKKRIILR